MIEFKDGHYGPWYAEITPSNDGTGWYSLLIKCDHDSDAYPLSTRIFDTVDLPFAISWRFNNLKDAKKKGRQELKAWKKKEKKAIAESLKPKPQDVIRIY